MTPVDSSLVENNRMIPVELVDTVDLLRPAVVPRPLVDLPVVLPAGKQELLVVGPHVVERAVGRPQRLREYLLMDLPVPQIQLHNWVLQPRILLVRGRRKADLLDAVVDVDLVDAVVGRRPIFFKDRGN